MPPIHLPLSMGSSTRMFLLTCQIGLTTLALIFAALEGTWLRPMSVSPLLHERRGHAHDASADHPDPFPFLGQTTTPHAHASPSPREGHRFLWLPGEMHMIGPDGEEWPEGPRPTKGDANAISYSTVRTRIGHIDHANRTGRGRYAK
jgi:hypothetical protein